MILENEQPQFKGKTVAVISIGTGLGCGLICDNALLQGENKLAGELGHMIFGATTTKPPLTLLRVREYCSGSGIARLASSLAENGSLRDLLSIQQSAPVTAEVICQRAVDGNPFAMKVWETFMDLLSILLFNVSCVVDPAVIVVGGGVTSSRMFDVQELEILTNSHRQGFLNRNPIRILPGRLGDKGVLYGLRSLHIQPPQGYSRKQKRL